jgi:dolichyl-phosphate beta-glucosyltransferase
MFMSGQPLLSVVIPAYNEEERLKRHIPAIVQFCQGHDLSFEIIVVNDGSHDQTSRVAADFHAHVIDLHPNRGKGAAVRAGMLAAQGRYVLFTDADQSTPIGEVEKLLVKVQGEGYGMAIGSRAAVGAAAQVWYRALAGKLFGLASRSLVIGGITDTQCGFKLMTREVAQNVFQQVTSNTAIFDIEMLAVAVREGYRVAEVPVHWVHDPDTRIPYNLQRALGIWAELFRIKRVVGKRMEVVR